MRSDFYEELIRRNDIVAVARELGMEVRGTKCRCLHPERHAHGDRSPSLALFRRDNSFRCWVCPDVRGSVIDLVMLARGVARAEAIRTLAARVGMTAEWENLRAERPARPAAPRAATLPPLQAGPDREETPAGPTLPPPPAAALPPTPALPLLLDDDRAHDIFAEFLRWCDRPSDRNYLTTKRGISGATLERMRVVWLHDAKEIEGRLRRQFPEEELLASGLFNEWGLIFRSYPILFPFRRGDRVLFIQGRRVSPGEPKYLGLRRPIPCLYNHDLLDTLAPGSPVLVSEGVVDTLTWLDQGVAAVGILGVGNFKREWKEALRPFHVLLCLDADEPGRRASQALRERFAAAGQEVQAVTLPPGVKDVNELFVSHPELVKKMAAGQQARGIAPPREG